jgi:hypothetical protein
MSLKKVFSKESCKNDFFHKKSSFPSFFSNNFFQEHFLLRKVYIFGFYVKFCVF